MPLTDVLKMFLDATLINRVGKLPSIDPTKM